MAGTRVVSRFRRSGVLSEDATTGGCATTHGSVRRDCARGHRPLGVLLRMRQEVKPPMHHREGFALRVHDMVRGDEDYEHQDEGYFANLTDDHGI